MASDTQSQKLVIHYYSDVLCVWAWIAQRRVDELKQTFGEKLEWQYRYINIFGDTETKMKKQWASRGLYEGFAEHVQHSAQAYVEAPVNPKLWSNVKPRTSSNAHLMLKAVDIIHGSEVEQQAAYAVRKAFFVDARNISEMAVLTSILDEQGLNVKGLTKVIESGQAIASLMTDYQLAKDDLIKGSPSYVLDGGRQTLYGNVGYRVLEANVEELLYKPKNEASWC